MSVKETLTEIALFERKEVRKTLYKNEWWFSVVDIIEVLTGTDRPRKYWSDLKKKLLEEGNFQLSEKIGQLKMSAPDGKQRETDCANTDLELIFTMLGEASTTEIARKRNAQGFPENKVAAQDGGAIAGNARKQLENKSGKEVSTRKNYLPKPKKKKRLHS